VPEFKKAATALKGVANVNVGALDCEQNEVIANKYKIRKYPTINIINGNTSTKYTGRRTSEAIVEAALNTKRALEENYSY
jgi:protein disulfide-isomerase A6